MIRRWDADPTRVAHAHLGRAEGVLERPGGRLAARCGGRGNVARVTAAADAGLDPGERSWSFAGPGGTEQRLRAAGFTKGRAWLQRWPTRLNLVARRAA